jgi:hypothetical protein
MKRWFNSKAVRTAVPVIGVLSAVYGVGCGSSTSDAPKGASRTGVKPTPVICPPAFRSLEWPVPGKPVDHLKLAHLPGFPTTRSEFFQTKSSLETLIPTLQSSADFTVKNKGWLFQQGLNQLQSLLTADPAFGAEPIEMVVAKGLHRPYLFNLPKPGKVKFDQDPAWMDYASVLASPGFRRWFADFANAVLGGGWRGHGNVQEEQMYQRCVELAIRSAAVTDHTRWDDGTYTQPPKHFAGENTASPILIKGLRCSLSFVGTYETDISRISKEDYSKKVMADVIQAAPISRADPSVHILAFAAPQLRSNDRRVPYSPLLALDLFNNAYTGMRMMKEADRAEGFQTYFETGLWGAGAFGHSARMSIAIQYLAARFAGIDTIMFKGIAEGSTVVDEAIALIDAALDHVYAGDPTVLHPVKDTLNQILLTAPLHKNWYPR